jgi:hypothetical protein
MLDTGSYSGVYPSSCKRSGVDAFVAAQEDVEGQNLLLMNLYEGGAKASF